MIKEVKLRDTGTLNKLLSIWKSAVERTHTFLSEDDINEITPDVKDTLINIENLYVYDLNDERVGFIGTQEQKIEMLFIHDQARGQGIGKKLISYAIQNLHTIYVDVNE